MKHKDKKQFEKELMNYIISKKLHPKESREILRACFEKRIYEKLKSYTNEME